jgi:CheY-like chemotaxis protein
LEHIFASPEGESEMHKILIVEDNFMIADMVEDTLIANGYDVCGIAPTVAVGLALWRDHHPDLLVVDLRLAHGELGTELVAKIGNFGDLGILYVTGNSGQLELSNTDGHACLGKPYIASDLLRALQIVTQLVETGEASRPFPPGFHLLGAGSPNRLVPS